jgi:hypothetical protein
MSTSGTTSSISSTADCIDGLTHQATVKACGNAEVVFSFADYGAISGKWLWEFVCALFRR